jgi:hypothetical protein
MVTSVDWKHEMESDVEHRESRPNHYPIGSRQIADIAFFKIKRRSDGMRRTVSYWPSQTCRQIPVRPGITIFTKSGGPHGVRNPKTNAKPLKFVAFGYHTS